MNRQRVRVRFIGRVAGRRNSARYGYARAVAHDDVHTRPPMRSIRIDLNVIPSSQTGDIAYNSIRPTMPFQLDSVRSSTAWAGPTGGSLALSTMTVIRCRPGVSPSVRSKICGVLNVLFAPNSRSSTHTRVVFVRSRNRMMRQPRHSSKMTTSR